MKNTNEKHIFFGLNAETLNLAESVAGARPDAEIVFVLDEAGADSTESPSGGISGRILRRERFRLSMSDFRDLLGGGANNLYFFSENSERNLNTAFAILETLKKAALAREVALYVETYAKDSDELFSRKRDELGMPFSFKTLKPAELAAFSLTSRVQPAALLEIDTKKGLPKEDFKMSLIGFGNFGRAAFLDLYRLGNFEGCEFNADIVDVNARYHSKAFAELYPGLIKSAILNFIEMNVSGSDFVDYLQNSMRDRKLFVVSLGNDGLNVKIANLICSIACENGQSPCVACCLWDDSFAANLENPEMVVTFGAFSKIYTAPVILDNALEVCGKLVNECYNSTKSDAYKMKNWNFMSRFEKDTNIFVALFNRAYSRLLGFDPLARFASEAEFKAYIRKDPELYENLSKVEHRRWMAYMYAAGWNVLPLSPSLIENKDEFAKLHTCLVPYDELDSVSAAFNEDYKQYDRDNIDMIYRIAQTLRQRI